MTMQIEMNNLSLKYKSNYALKEINCQLNGQGIYGLIGRNGAGKTSLLSMLASFQEPTSGTLTIDGETPFENAKIMQQVNFIFNKDYTDETDNVSQLLKWVSQYRPHFDSKYADYLVQKFRLPMKKSVKKLSKGMQAAVNVTIGLASRAPITIFDEAYNGMDAPTREIFYEELLEEQARFPRMMILSTHLVSEMEHLFDEVLFLHKGKLILQEEFEAVTSKGTAVTGPAEDVDLFVQEKKQLNTKSLGHLKSVMIYGELSDSEREKAQANGLELGPISLQDLFIHLTEEEE
ncbi:ATP-binding cassette domain-containing protein [Metabacillus malikii]|uniref:ABC-2 type transport system ATP-binding protein n=1 Tax=Metabacillus malikii TaxID=1504265 RepID=A0ABT9ZCQ0_9BACI|nr:ABC transporter ATP-binding protein [Metabacillus malikii]MDQ0229040.1 ABC-2 type transport system ATP-binding protein [Metabacillus malikii]